jgi:hypothetical protein
MPVSTCHQFHTLELINKKNSGRTTHLEVAALLKGVAQEDVVPCRPAGHRSDLLELGLHSLNWCEWVKMHSARFEKV